ncbi:hypothetical protein QFZ69_000028 [Arthrobacter sp. V1I7]|nr:hypothetical protein [Arthrobacter sp. V1I7]
MKIKSVAAAVFMTALLRRRVAGRNSDSGLGCRYRLLRQCRRERQQLGKVKLDAVENAYKS